MALYLRALRTGLWACACGNAEARVLVHMCGAGSSCHTLCASVWTWDYYVLGDDADDCVFIYDYCVFAYGCGALISCYTLYGSVWTWVYACASRQC